ncbi:glycoside hydrolase family 68 protein [Sphingomonas pokkalii]|uniref:Glycoside hydrolase 68 family protein n=1 Tax=Sphingomonas pokkalii TaxID=2175090 RepID=A0A2U0SCD2_9SPHN|nr:glycoside hydrolase family 68 protein [Sphingomonas pokkalii]PVX28935.1 glycoside hydrolase 68 family protein [Sphingomonas pokkalii]
MHHLAPAPEPCAHWTGQAVAGIPAQRDAALPVLAQGGVPLVPGHDVWDMWQIAHPDGRTVLRAGRSWWFFLAAPRLDDPEGRHDLARIWLTSHGDDGWRDHGQAFPEGFTPGSREWSGSAVLEDDGVTLTHYFTAAGRRGEATTFEQRLFVSTGRFQLDGETPRLDGWTTPEEIVAADGAVYAVADEAVAAPQGIKGFRDPGYFRDPADGTDYVLFTANAGWVDTPVSGVIGIARRDDGPWRLESPILSSIGVNSELERPHILYRDGAYYLFWSTQARRFAEGIVAPTGLYAMVADSMQGAWRPVNGTGLVAANPPERPTQAYCWWVTGEGDVLSFIDYAGIDADGAVALADAEGRRRYFGGAPAPFFSLDFAGDRVTIRQ